MIFRRMLTLLLCTVLITLSAGTVFCEGCTPADETAADGKIHIKVLILSKFEVDDYFGDFPGEAQFYHEYYLEDDTTYEIPGGMEGSRLHVSGEVALYVTGMGKVNAALSTMAVLSDDRFDFSDAYILSTGCAGGATGFSVMGDVVVVSAAVDYDLGHHADIRDLAAQASGTWFHDPDYDSAAVVMLNPDLTERAFELVKDLPMATTQNTRNYMRTAFNGAEWAVRDPKVLRGTTVTGDNYWKGSYDHANALQMVQTYSCPDPFATTEMEEIGVCLAARRMGMLNRLIILRGVVNMDTFLLGATPEKLWDPQAELTVATEEENIESVDIFITEMANIFSVGSTIIDAILNGNL